MVWDLPVRIFHWTLVAGIAIAWFSAGTPGRLHELAGYVVLGAVLFRVVWGLIGTRHALFRDFVRGQRAVLTYLKSLRRHDAPRFIGHNPAGGWMILGLLTLLVVISATGVMQLTGQFFGEEWVEITHEWSANALLVLIPIHVAGAVVSSRLHRENLIKAMIVGWKPARTGDPISASGFRDDIVTRLHGLEGLVLLMVCSATAFFYGWQTTSGVVRDLQTAPAAGITTAPPATRQSQPIAQLTTEMYGPLLSEETKRRLKKKRRWRSRK